MEVGGSEEAPPEKPPRSKPVVQDVISSLGLTSKDLEDLKDLLVRRGLSEEAATPPPPPPATTPPPPFD